MDLNKSIFGPHNGPVRFVSFSFHLRRRERERESEGDDAVEEWWWHGHGCPLQTSMETHVLGFQYQLREAPCRTGSAPF